MTALQMATLNVARQIKKRNDEESQHQRALVEWAAMARFPVPLPFVRADEFIGDFLFAVPNGGMRTKAVAGKLKAEGVKAGVWDLKLEVPIGRCPGLWIEMKAGSNTLTTEQRTWRDRMKRAGYQTVVCWDWTLARDAILNYLSAAPGRVHMLSELDEVEGTELAHPKRKEVRSPKYLAEVRRLRCANCGVEGYSEAAHPNSGKGMGKKADDNLAFPLCKTRPGVHGCHPRFDQHALYSKEERRVLEVKWGRMTFGAIQRAGKVPMGMPYPKFPN